MEDRRNSTSANPVLNRNVRGINVQVSRPSGPPFHPLRPQLALLNHIPPDIAQQSLSHGQLLPYDGQQNSPSSASGQSNGARNPVQPLHFDALPPYLQECIQVHHYAEHSGTMANRLTDENSELRTDNAGLGQRVYDLSAASGELTTQNTTLEQANSGLEEKLKSERQRVIDLQQAKKELEDKVENEQKRIKVLEQDRQSQAEAHAAELEAALADHEALKMVVRERMLAAKRQEVEVKAELEMTVTGLERTIDELHLGATQAQKTLEYRNDEVERLRGDFKILSSEKEVLETINNELSDQMKAASATANDLQEQLTGQEDENNGLTRILKDRGEQLAAAKKSFEILEEEKQTLLNDVQTEQRQLIAATTDLACRDADITKLKAKNAKLTVKYVAVRKKKRAYATKVGLLDEYMSFQNKMVASHREDNGEHGSESENDGDASGDDELDEPSAPSLQSQLGTALHASTPSMSASDGTALEHGLGTAAPAEYDAAEVIIIQTRAVDSMLSPIAGTQKSSSAPETSMKRPADCSSAERPKSKRKRTSSLNSQSVKFLRLLAS